MLELINHKFEALDMSGLGFIDLVIADPPDNCGKNYVGVDDNIDDTTYQVLFRRWIKKCCDCCNGPVFFIPAEKYIPLIEEMIFSKQIKLIQRIIWYYTFGQHHAKRYGSCFRPIYWLNNDTIYPDQIKIPSARQEKYKDKRAKGGGKMPENVWSYSRICGTFKERRKWHECQLPEQMIKRIILGHSKEGDTVLDPFIGSGTTAIVAAETNRNCIGVDASGEYISNIRQELRSRA